MSEIRQRAEGSYIIQAGGNINSAPSPVNTDNLIPCPECEQLVSRYAANCLACGFPVDRFFAERISLKRQKRNERITVLSMSIIYVFGVGMIYFTFPNVEWKDYIPFVGAGLLAFALTFRRFIRKLAEWGF